MLGGIPEGRSTLIAGKSGTGKTVVGLQIAAHLANADALIIDLRRNGGGSPAMVQLVSSYLFDEPTHLNFVVMQAMPKEIVDKANTAELTAFVAAYRSSQREEHSAGGVLIIFVKPIRHRERRGHGWRLRTADWQRRVHLRHECFGSPFSTEHLPVGV